jgi:hypothetical protein
MPHAVVRPLSPGDGGIFVSLSRRAQTGREGWIRKSPTTAYQKAAAPSLPHGRRKSHPPRRRTVNGTTQRPTETQDRASHHIGLHDGIDAAQHGVGCGFKPENPEELTTEAPRAGYAWRSLAPDRLLDWAGIAAELSRNSVGLRRLVSVSDQPTPRSQLRSRLGGAHLGASPVGEALVVKLLRDSDRLFFPGIAV